MSVAAKLAQADLFDWVGPLEESFAEFDRDHPEVWRLFERFAFEAIQRGHRHHSADAILHVVRWETDANAHGKPYKVNNNFTPYFARKFQRAHPQHAGFFRNRKSKADEDTP
jgi:hypothetical protein